MRLITNIAKFCHRHFSSLAYLLIACSLFFSLGMGVRPYAEKLNTSWSTKTKVKVFLHRMESAYAAESLAGFYLLLDRDFENFLSFKNSLQDEFLNKKNLNVKFYLDTILTEDDKVFSRIHWYKKYSNLSGSLFKTKGSSEFLFIAKPEKLVLKYIRGDNPFF